MIKLVTVIGHGVNLLPHFIQHYNQYVDEISVVIYETEQFPTISNEVKEVIKDYENIRIVKTHKDRVFDWEKVTKLYNYVTKRQPNQWWVVADIDEFHLYPNNNLKEIIDRCDDNGWEIVRGGFIDRIGPNGEFSKLEPNTQIFEQFPNAGFFRYPLSNACPNKICLKKGYIELTSGQHYANIKGHTTWKWQGWNHPLINPFDTVQVHHFKWDSTSIERIKSVADINQDYAYSNEYKVMYDELRKTKFKINLNEKRFMFEEGTCYPKYEDYKSWNKLIKQIILI